MALWGFGAKCWSGLDWSGVEWMDTPQTVTTTRAPAVLKKLLQAEGKPQWHQQILWDYALRFDFEKMKIAGPERSTVNFVGQCTTDYFQVSH